MFTFAALMGDMKMKFEINSIICQTGLQSLNVFSD